MVPLVSGVAVVVVVVRDGLVVEVIIVVDLLHGQLYTPTLHLQAFIHTCIHLRLVAELDHTVVVVVAVATLVVVVLDGRTLATLVVVVPITREGLSPTRVLITAIMATSSSNNYNIKYIIIIHDG
jgi:hypothetical protein|tara:strand:+ start:564 stop:938 length:375 start_codon:yes stop_codon:yes gene_type:complete